MLIQRSEAVSNFASLRTTPVDAKRGYRLLIVGHAVDPSGPTAVTAGSNTIRSVRTVSDITDEFPALDPTDQDTILPFALWKAIPPTVPGVTTADLPEVFFVLAEDDTDIAYQAALQSAVFDGRYTWVVTLRDNTDVRNEIDDIAATREGLGFSTVPIISLATPASSTPATEIAGYQSAADGENTGSIVVWPPEVTYDGDPVDQGFFRAAVGGLLGMSAVHQPLRGLALPSEWSSVLSTGPYAGALAALQNQSPGLFTLVLEEGQLRIDVAQTNDTAADQDLWVTVVGTREQVRREVIRAVQGINVPSNESDARRTIRNEVRDVLDGLQSSTRRSDLDVPSFSSYTLEVVLPTNPGDCIEITIELVVPISLVANVCVTVNAQVV